jgi:hypothetical protein
MGGVVHLHSSAELEGFRGVQAEQYCRDGSSPGLLLLWRMN